MTIKIGLELSTQKRNVPSLYLIVDEIISMHGNGCFFVQLSILATKFTVDFQSLSCSARQLYTRKKILTHST